MTFLIADVGGTNTRIALSDASGEVHGIARFPNDDHAGFASVLTRFAGDRTLPQLSGCCVAIAGPVTQHGAKLTNRDWTFDIPDIAATLGLSDPRRVCLINDLAGLGHALPALKAAQLENIRPARTDGASADQALVAGLGTGFNVCLVKYGRQGPVVVEAELGHASLPERVVRSLDREVGASAAAAFDSIEALFSGRGLSRLHEVLSGSLGPDGGDILAAYEGDPQDGPARRTVNLMAQLLGVFARELVFQYLPFGGIHFAGGAARGILGSRARTLFLSGLETQGRFSEQVAQVPIRMITDDAAALTGAARYFTYADRSD